MFTMDELRQKCEECLQEAICRQDEELIERLCLDKQLLQDDDFFKAADYLRVIFIMDDMGFTTKQAIELFNHYNPRKIVRGRLRCRENGGIYLTEEVDLQPDCESYYQFEDGTVFKAVNDSDFYWLCDGCWEYDGDLQRKIYDAQYEYSTIGYQLSENDRQE